MNILLRVALVVAVLVTPAAAQTSGTAGDGTLAGVLDSIRVSANLPALAGMLIHGDSILELAAVGFRSYGHDEPVSLDDFWHIGSNTKAMTATLAGVLVDRGEIGWSTTVSDVFPELRDSIRAEFVDVTLAELLSHTAGVSNDVFETPSWATLRENQASLRDQRRAWIRELLSLEPGAERDAFGYSNSGYVVAGAMLERVTDVAWEELMRRQIFAPLGMLTAGFGAPGTEATVDQPRGHVVGSGQPVPISPGPWADNPAALGPAGTVHASMRDYARFVIAHLAGGRTGTTGIVGEETFAVLHTPPSGDQGYAFGWFVMDRAWAGGAALMHNGSNTMWFHTVWIAPARNFAVVAVTNVAGPDAPGAVDRAISAMIQRVERWLESRESG